MSTKQSAKRAKKDDSASKKEDKKNVRKKPKDTGKSISRSHGAARK